jgi:hypothetical protein
VSGLRDFCHRWCSRKPSADFRRASQFIAVGFMTKLMIHILYPQIFMSFVPGHKLA